MKTRRPLAKPCERKGEVGKKTFKYCSLSKKCGLRKKYLKPTSSGTKKHKLNFDTKFEGCFDVEDYLIKNYLLRYDPRETSGFEVLFNGIEKIHDLNASVFNSAFLDGIENDDILGAEIDTGEHKSTIQNKLESALTHSETTYKSFRDTDEAKSLKETIPNAVDLAINPLEDLQLQLNLPACLSMSAGMMADIWNKSPNNLVQSILIEKWQGGFFDTYDVKIKVMAYFLMKSFVDEELAIKVYGGENTEEFDNAKKEVRAIIRIQMPGWAKKFPSFLKTLTDKQKEAINLEYFYKTDEKPTQEEAAKKLEISVDSYKERLELAYRKLEAHYPEFKRVVRKDKLAEAHKKRPIYDLYLVKDGKKTLIKPTKKQIKAISPEKFRDIKRWAYENTSDLVKNINRPHFTSYETNTNFWKKNKLTPAQMDKIEQKKLLKEELGKKKVKELTGDDEDFSANIDILAL